MLPQSSVLSPPSSVLRPYLRPLSSVLRPSVGYGDPMRALLVEDDARIADFVANGLREAGFVVDRAAEGDTGLDLATRGQHDVAVVDLMLPHLDGLALIQQMRQRGVQTPVLILSAKHTVDDRVAGLTAGGDDYVTKPFSLEEVIARLRGLLRRSGATTVRPDTQIVVGDLILDEDSHEVTRAGEPIHLTATEFELLRFLMRNPKRVLSKAQILDRVWNYDFGGQANVVEL